MPELPEVESVRQCLLQSPLPLPGSRVEAVNVRRSSVVDGLAPERFAALLTGAVFHEIVRHGKYLFFRFTSAHVTSYRWMVLHLRMTGRLHLLPAAPEAGRHARLVLLLNGQRMLIFEDPRAFGRVWLVADPQEVTAGLGPDALEVGEEPFIARLAAYRRQLKPLLLDQSFVAGIGNIYADESLFRAGLHPLRNVADLNSSEQARLYRAVHDVMHQAVSCKGANIDGVFEAGRFPVAVYGRTDQPCQVCGTAVIKLRVGQRGTHLCPHCQPLH